MQGDRFPYCLATITTQEHGIPTLKSGEARKTTSVLPFVSILKMRELVSTLE